MSSPPSSSFAVPVTSVSPDRLQPGPISSVGAGCRRLAPATGNQWARICVPSNEVIVQSLGTSGDGAAVTGATGRSTHRGRLGRRGAEQAEATTSYRKKSPDLRMRLSVTRAPLSRREFVTR